MIYKCKDCGKDFRTPKFFKDEKGEYNAVCPNCSSYNYMAFEPDIEKSEVLRTLLCVIRHVNCYCDNLKEMYGVLTQNDDINEIYGILEELIEETYDEFATPQIANAVRHIRTVNDVNKVILKLEG